MKKIYAALLYWSLTAIRFGSGANNVCCCHECNITATCATAQCTDGELRLSSIASCHVEMCHGGKWSLLTCQQGKLDRGTNTWTMQCSHTISVAPLVTCYRSTYVHVFLMHTYTKQTHPNTCMHAVEPQCMADQIRIAYESEVKSLEVCRSKVWKMCMDTSPCNNMNGE